MGTRHVILNGILRVATTRDLDRSLGSSVNERKGWFRPKPARCPPSGMAWFAHVCSVVHITRAVSIRQF